MPFDDEDAPSTGPTLIRAYGEYWSKAAIDWTNKQILGHRRKYKVTVKNSTAKEKLCNAWEQRGIYALYKDFKWIYVGLASSSSSGIGSRLHSHATKPRLRDRWDTFSWFGVDGYDIKGGIDLYIEQKLSASTIARTLELVAIHSRSSNEQIAREV